MTGNKDTSSDLGNNIHAIRTILGESSDLQIRDILLTRKDKKAAVLFIDGIVDSNSIQEYILEPLLTYPFPNFQIDEELLSFLESAVIQTKKITRVENINLASVELLTGKTLIIVEGCSTILSTDTTKWNGRSIESPKGQRVAKGPDQGFNENRSTNISLVRKIIKNPNLRVTTKQYGTKTHTDISVMYLENVVDKKVLQTIYKRLDSLHLDAVLGTNYIESVLTKESMSFFPLMLNTDRPDVVAAEILEGKIAIFVDGTPYVLIAPAVFIQFFQTPEDYYFSNTGFINTRLLRFCLFFVSLYIPGVYVAFMTYHANLLPVKLLVGFVSQRELVPFPTSLEVTILIIVIIAINESSTRLQQNIAVTISIFGGIILGQSAIEAQLVEPASLVIVSLTYILTSVIPIYQLRITAANIVFCFIAAGAALGLYGIALLSLLLLVHLCSLRSFGVPYLSPFAPLVGHDLKDSAIQLSLVEMTNDESQFMSEETMEETYKSNNKVKLKHMKSNINIFLAIGIIFSIIVSKQVQDTLLNKLSVVSAIGIDKSKDGYIASLQIYNPASNSKEGAAETGSYTYSAKGRTLPEAMESIQNKVARPIFLDNTEVAVIGEALAKSEGISSITNYFMRESNLPANIRFVISKGVTANKLLRIFTPLQKISGSRFEEMLIRKRESWGRLSDITSNNIKEKIVQNRTEVTIPYITMNGSFSKGTSKANIETATPETILSLEGLAVFQDQKLSYWLSSEESNLYALIQGKIKDTTIITKCQKQKGYVTWKDVRGKPQIQISDNKGVPSFHLQLQITGKLSDVSCKIDTSNTKNIASLEHEAERELQKRINKLLEKTQNKKTDIKGFGEALYRKQPRTWNRLKNHWNSIYSTVQIQTNVRIKVLDVGDISS